ncbi:hypothetical protein WJX79_008356 [Trebouxia sp. C0005]
MGLSDYAADTSVKSDASSKPHICRASRLCRTVRCPEKCITAATSSEYTPAAWRDKSLTISPLQSDDHG